MHSLESDYLFAQDLSLVVGDLVDGVVVTINNKGVWVASLHLSHVIDTVKVEWWVIWQSAVGLRAILAPSPSIY